MLYEVITPASTLAAFTATLRANFTSAFSASLSSLASTSSTMVRTCSSERNRVSALPWASEQAELPMAWAAARVASSKGLGSMWRRMPASRSALV